MGERKGELGADFTKLLSTKPSQPQNKLKARRSRVVLGVFTNSVKAA
jgi:hypothetical protein